MILYLVENVEDRNEVVILNICRNRDKAFELQEEYRKNFRDQKYNNPEDIIEVEELDLDELDDEIVWSYDV